MGPLSEEDLKSDFPCAVHPHPCMTRGPLTLRDVQRLRPLQPSVRLWPLSSLLLYLLDLSPRPPKHVRILPTEQGTCSDLGPLRAACSLPHAQFCSGPRLQRAVARPGHCGPHCQARGPALRQEHFTVYREFHVYNPTEFPDRL